MIESKGWNWKIVNDEKEEIWKNPSVESYYLLNRWKSQNKKYFLDLGCGLGRHSILFGKNEFSVSCFDISQEAINRTREWDKKENWPLIDENTRLRMEEGPEYKVPHFYVDYNLAKDLFSNFKIINIHQEIEYYEKQNGTTESYHYHILIQKH